MKELLELMFSTDGTMFVSVIILLVITSFLFKVLDSLFKNVFKPLMQKANTKTKIKKVYVDEFGDEIEK